MNSTEFPKCEELICHHSSEKSCKKLVIVDPSMKVSLGGRAKLQWCSLFKRYALCFVKKLENHMRKGCFFALNFVNIFGSACGDRIKSRSRSKNL